MKKKRFSTDNFIFGRSLLWQERHGAAMLTDENRFRGSGDASISDNFLSIPNN